MLARYCPRCGSTLVKSVPYLSTVVLVCSACGFDERDELDGVAQQKVSQKAKGSYSVYRAGGPKGKR